MAGRSWTVWVYGSIPEGVRLATILDLRPGRPVLYQARIGPDAGSWYQDWVRRTTIEPLRQMIREGLPVYVK